MLKLPANHNASIFCRFSASGTAATNVTGAMTGNGGSGTWAVKPGILGQPGAVDRKAEPCARVFVFTAVLGTELRPVQDDESLFA
jgi:hypothetical protein